MITYLKAIWEESGEIHWLVSVQDERNGRGVYNVRAFCTASTTGDETANVSRGIDNHGTRVALLRKIVKISLGAKGWASASRSGSDSAPETRASAREGETLLTRPTPEPAAR